MTDAQRLELNPAPDGASDAPNVMASIARRAAMTEGQLYTAVIAVLATLLLTLTGLPNAAERAAPPPPVTAPNGEVAP